MRRMICVLMVLLPFLVLPALGAELSFPQVDELLQEAEGYGVTETVDLGQGVQSILETGLDQAGSLLHHSLQTGLKLLAVVLLCGLAESAALDGKAGGLKAVEVAGALAVTALTVSDMNAMIGLGRETIQQMDAFVAMCDRDEENLMTGLFAVKQGVPKVIVKNNRVAYADIISGMGLDSIVSPKASTCTAILRYVRARVNGEGTKVERLYRLMNGKAEAMEFIARGKDPYIGIPLKNLVVRPGTLVAVIVRQSKVIVPFGDDHIEDGDRVVVIACENGIDDLNEVIHR